MFKNTHMNTQHFSSIKAANVGCSSGNKWIKIFDLLFVVMNEAGFINKFRFIKRTSFDQVDDLISQLANENSSPEFIYVDNCCKVRSILEGKFSGIKVKLVHPQSTPILHGNH